MSAALSPDELRRYARHLILPELGPEGQQRLKDGRVLVVGAGGLGSPAALYLAAAGVGTLGLVDDDVVDAANLQRQILHGTAGVGRPKLDSAEARITDLNPHVAVERFDTRLTSTNALGIVREFDLVVDGSDNFPTRYLVNDACVLTGRPDVYGAIFRFEGQASVFDATRGPCYRCLFRDPPPPELVPSCVEAGVIGAIPGLIGSLQALEAIKLVAGIGQPLVGRLMIVDGLNVKFRELKLQKDPSCPVCGDERTVTELVDYDALCGTAATAAPGERSVRPEELVRELGGARPPLLLDVRESWEWGIGHLEGAIHLPLGELPVRFGELDPERAIVTYCHHGIRSLDAQRMLLAAGFRNVRSLEGGIDAWAREIDASQLQY